MTDLRKAAEMALDALEAIMFTKNVGSAHIIAKNARYSLRESLTYKGANEKLAQSDNQEPVAYWNGKNMFKRADEVQYVVNWTDYYHYPLYSKPVKERISEPVANLEPVAWTKVSDGLPKSGVTVLACYRNSLGNLRRIRAHWIAAKTEESNGDYDEFFEYDEETDTYYAPEGWYECIDNWGDYSSVRVCEGEVTHWMPLPPAPDEQLRSKNK